MHDLVPELAWRGQIHDQTPDIEARLTEGPVTGYIGFDPTAPSLQVGNLVPVMLLAHLQRAGGTPIALVGGTTAMIGDPSGRSEERPLLTREQVDENADRMRGQLERFLDFEGRNAARMRNNADWLRPLTLVDFLRETGKHFTLSYMLQKESVRSRMDAGISYTEFSYMLLQAYDYLHLFEHEGCELQMGGSDQWGNITAGVELVRRVTGRTVHALSAPLLTTAAGAKFGKSAGGAVWLDPTLTSPYRFYQFWINTDDRDVENYLRTFTFLDRPAVEEMMADLAANPAARGAQRTLATDLTARVHGAETVARVAEASRIMFGEADLRLARPDAWEVLEHEVPTWSVARDALPPSVVDLAAASGLTSSKGDARRQLQQGGISVNGEKVGLDATVGPDDLLAGKYLWLRRGKKTDVIVRVN